MAKASPEEQKKYADIISGINQLALLQMKGNELLSKLHNKEITESTYRKSMVDVANEIQEVFDGMKAIGAVTEEQVNDIVAAAKKMCSMV